MTFADAFVLWAETLDSPTTMNGMDPEQQPDSIERAKLARELRQRVLPLLRAMSPERRAAFVGKIRSSNMPTDVAATVLIVAAEADRK